MLRVFNNIFNYIIVPFTTVAFLFTGGLEPAFYFIGIFVCLKIWYGQL